MFHIYLSVTTFSLFLATVSQRYVVLLTLVSPMRIRSVAHILSSHISYSSPSLPFPSFPFASLCLHDTTYLRFLRRCFHIIRSLMVIADCTYVATSHPSRRSLGTIPEVPPSSPKDTTLRTVPMYLQRLHPPIPMVVFV